MPPPPFSPGPLPARLCRFLLLLLWAFELARIALPIDAAAPAAAIVALLYLGFALRLARRITVVISTALALITLATAVLGGRPGDLIQGLDRALIFTAFIPTLVWMRAAAERSRAIVVSRGAFATMTPSARNAGLMVGAHLFGGVITAGVFGLFGPLIPDHLDQAARARAAQATIRGMSLAILWSPCFVGMAVASRLVPGVPLWQVVPLGLGCALIGLVLADLLFGTRDPRTIMRSMVSGFRPILLPLAVGAGGVVALSSLTFLSSIEAVLVALPPLGAVWILIERPRQLTTAVLETWRRMGHVSDDLVIVLVAMTLAVVIAGNPAIGAALGTLAELGLPAPVMLAAILTAMTFGGMLGLHPMVSVSVLIPLAASLPGLAEPVLMLTALYGWSLGTMNSVSSMTVAMASSAFRTRIEQVTLDQNLVFIPVFLCISILVLSATNAVLSS